MSRSNTSSTTSLRAAQCTLFLRTKRQAGGFPLPIFPSSRFARGRSHQTTTLHTSAASSFHDFELRLAELMKYNENPPKDKLGTARNDLDLVKDIMVRQILIFGERIELLIDKTDHLSGQAYAFRRGARTVRRQQFWRNQKILAIGIFAGLFFFYILVAQFCGVGLNHCSG